MRKLVASVCICVLSFLGAASASASECSHNPGALGVSRVIEVDTTNGPLLGSLQYQTSLELGPKEVVLTFDDGPHPRNTPRILDALKAECVQATFFPVGSMAENHPETLQAVAEAGHTIGGHTWSHPNLSRMSDASAKDQIERGFEAIRAAVRQPIAPFFRFPGLNHSDAMKSYAAERGYAVFSCDLNSDDWRGISARTIVRRTMARLNRQDKGIVLMHDTKWTTAKALPMLFRQLKRGGYKIVHIVPQHVYGPVETASAESAEKAAPAEAGQTEGQVAAVNAEVAGLSTADAPTGPN